MTTKLDDKRSRAARCNELIATIADCGRRFFRAGETVAHLEVSDRGKVFFVEGDTRVFTHYEGEWREFQHGGTLRNLIIAMREYICGDRETFNGYFGPWPDWVNGGDPWGYGEDMVTVRDKAKELGLIS